MESHLTEEGGGHMATCDCGHFTWWPTRGEAERARDAHKAKHKPKEGAG